MIDQEIAKIANDRIRIEIEEQHSRLRSEIGRFMIKMRDDNAVQSSSSIVGIANLCIDTIKNRGKIGKIGKNRDSDHLRRLPKVKQA